MWLACILLTIIHDKFDMHKYLNWIVLSSLCNPYILGCVWCLVNLGRPQLVILHIRLWLHFSLFLISADLGVKLHLKIYFIFIYFYFISIGNYHGNKFKTWNLVYWDRRYGLEVNNTCCSWRESRFTSHQPHAGLPPSITPVIHNITPLPYLQVAGLHIVYINTGKKTHPHKLK